MDEYGSGWKVEWVHGLVDGGLYGQMNRGMNIVDIDGRNERMFIELSKT